MPFAANAALFHPIVPMKSKAAKIGLTIFMHILFIPLPPIMVWAMRVPNRIDVYKARMEITRIRKVTEILLKSPTGSAMRPGCVICCSFLAASSQIG